MHQDINGHTRHRQKQQIQEHDAGPFTGPDFPARDRFHRHHLHLAFLDVARQRAASEPQRGEPQQRGDGAERVGEQNLRESLRRAVVLDDRREPNDRAEQQDDQYLHQPVAEGGFEREFGDGQQALHDEPFEFKVEI